MDVFDKSLFLWESFSLIAVTNRYIAGTLRRLIIARGYFTWIWTSYPDRNPIIVNSYRHYPDHTFGHCLLKTWVEVCDFYKFILMTVREFPAVGFVVISIYLNNKGSRTAWGFWFCYFSNQHTSNNLWTTRPDFSFIVPL